MRRLFLSATLVVIFVGAQESTSMSGGEVLLEPRTTKFVTTEVQTNTTGVPWSIFLSYLGLFTALGFSVGWLVSVTKDDMIGALQRCFYHTGEKVKSYSKRSAMSPTGSTGSFMYADQYQLQQPVKMHDASAGFFGFSGAAEPVDQPYYQAEPLKPATVETTQTGGFFSNWIGGTAKKRKMVHCEIGNDDFHRFERSVNRETMVVTQECDCFTLDANGLRAYGSILPGWELCSYHREGGQRKKNMEKAELIQMLDAGSLNPFPLVLYFYLPATDAPVANAAPPASSMSMPGTGNMPSSTITMPQSSMNFFPMQQRY